MVDELVDQADQVATKIEAVAAANEEQTTQVHEINTAIQQLTHSQQPESNNTQSQCPLGNDFS
ncbi:hypothetical protein [Halobacterium noricense]|uniref:hypothetical protein n=1 Tax=Halobacterium noricense TaxID=223182 RepID=UPI001E3F5225|nr:hypothetical protein [Halobacterium noricense]UHH26678.1 hypothetical protein LT974_07040 [Halobacterium noricense]